MQHNYYISDTLNSHNAYAARCMQNQFNLQTQ